MTHSLEKEIKSKHSLFRQYKRTPTSTCREAFNKQRNRVTRLLRKAERAYVLRLYRDTASSGSSPSQLDFWDFMRSLAGSSHRSPIPDLNHGDSVLSSPTDKAEALNAFFVQRTHLSGSDASPDASSVPVNEENFLNFYDFG